LAFFACYIILISSFVYYIIKSMDAPISYAIVIGFFIGFAAILFGSRAKRLVKKKESPVGAPGEIKHSPA
jgi:hypothetical protein